MRTSEWIQIGFAIILAAAAWIQPFFSRHPLHFRRRWTITLLALVPWVVVSLARASAGFLPPLYVSVLRDWLTAGLFLVPYWQTGQFFQAPNHRIEEYLMDFDRWLMPRAAGASGTARTGFGMVLEVAYLFCYPLVPLGLLALYLVGQREHAAGFWLVVPGRRPTCVTRSHPFVPAYPPRDLAGSPAGPERKRARRGSSTAGFSKHGSIHAISFPCAHVASSLRRPRWCCCVSRPILGLVFLFVIDLDCAWARW